MCSIFGVFSADKPLNGALNNLREASLFMKRRGPDDSGEWLSPDGKIFLAHNRLSIIDLSENASQPMFSRDGKKVVVFNGEIYNYRDLKEKIGERYEFKTDSDTEVLLALYEVHGDDFLQMIEGMFAFCIVDLERKRILCARDRVGEKPLYYFLNERKNLFAFASTPRALLECGIVPREFSLENALMSFVENFKHIAEPYSAWKGIEKLFPSEYMILDYSEGKLKPLRRFYWKPDPARYSGKSYVKDLKKAKSLLREKFVEAVDRVFVADVPVVVLFSGGVDSSLVAAVAKKILGKDVHAVVFGGNEDDEEVKRAEEMAKILGLKLEKIFLTQGAVDTFREILAWYGEPVRLRQIVFSHLIYSALRERKYKVAITGNGGDELFHGYLGNASTVRFSKYVSPISSVFPSFNPLLKEKVLKKRFRSELSHLASDSELMELFRSLHGEDFDLEELALNAWRRFLRFYSEAGEFLKFFFRRRYIDFSSAFGLFFENAHSITIVADMVGMYSSVEVRSPFLNHNLIDLAYALHPSLKIPDPHDRTGSTFKFVLKKAFEDILPPCVLNRPKMGFGYNVSENDLFTSRSLDYFAIESMSRVLG